jgi:hypothetical protein
MNTPYLLTTSLWPELAIFSICFQDAMEAKAHPTLSSSPATDAEIAVEV